MPILIVCPCASARGAKLVATANASTSAVARIIRADFIVQPPRKKVGCSVSRARLTRENHPLASLPSARGAQRRERALDREGGSEQPAHLGLRHDEGRTRVHRAQWEEAGEEPAARAQRARQRLHVLGAPRRIDRAEARVLPDAVEGVGQLASEAEDVAILEGDVDAVASRERARRRQRGWREIEADRLVAARGEQPGIVAAAAARHGDSAEWWRRRVEHVDEWWRRTPELPAVGAARVRILPERHSAHTGHRTSSKCGTVRSAPAARSSSAVCAVVTPMARIPAARAACTPTIASSKTTHAVASTPSRSAAFK